MSDASRTETSVRGAFSRGDRARSLLQRFGLLLSFLLLGLALSLLSDRFLLPSNLINILRQASINAIISVGMTMVILTGGIDLSVGSVLALSAVVAADALKSGAPVGLVIIGALLLGGLLGLINGAFISRLHIPPFIATLGMLTVARGLTLIYTQGQPITGLPAAFRTLGTGSLGPVPMPVVIALLVYAAGIIFLTRTRYGEYIYMLGDNPTAARFAGVPVTKMTLLVYVISGICAALAGLILIARLDSAQPVIGQGYEFDAIAAVVVGGTSFAGGEGSLLGTLLGAVFLETINNGLNLLDVSSLWGQVVKGAVIALALLLYKGLSPRER